jgi:glycosyltransferase involved in cell wall biosynthesis
VPTVSVIMAVYNAHDTIVRAVRSVLDQTHADLELLLVDDASTDGSLDVVREHLETAGGDDRVRYLTHEHNRRAAAARNTGVEAARGDFVAFLDSDDELLPTYLETLVGHLGEGVDIVVGNVVYVRPDGSRRERHPAAVGDFAGPRAAALGLLDKITPFTCDKLIRRTLFDDVRYPEGIIPCSRRAHGSSVWWTSRCMPTTCARSQSRGRPSRPPQSSTRPRHISGTPSWRRPAQRPTSCRPSTMRWCS